MYDPARDTFTTAEASTADPHGTIESDKNHTEGAAQEKKKVSELQGSMDDRQSGHKADTFETTSPMTRKRSRSRESSTAAPRTSSPRISQYDSEGQAPASKKSKTAHGPVAASTDAPIPTTAENLPQFLNRKPREKLSRNQRRSRSPAHVEQSTAESKARSRSPNRRRTEVRKRDRRSPARNHSPSPKPLERSPSPIDRDRSPPRQRKRPGGTARIANVEREAIRQRQVEREQQQVSQAQADAAARGVRDVVTQHYNAVPQRGREWRKTDSKIKGLRSFNNWVKSALIQKFSPSQDYGPGASENRRFSEQNYDDSEGLLVLDIGCGKGGDLQKWQSAPQPVTLYVGLDPAEISINQARQRYVEMRKGSRGRYDRRKQNLFRGEFIVKDCFGEWLGDIPIIQQVGIDGSVGPDGGMFGQRFGGGGFDVVSMMFCMHYAFQDQEKAKMMLRNVAGSLKKGGRFLGVIPNSDVLTSKVEEFNRRTRKGQAQRDDSNDAADEDEDDWDPEKTLDAPPGQNGQTERQVESWDPERSLEGPEDAPNGKQVKELEDGQIKSEEILEWGNSIYRVKFPGKVPDDGVFRPPFGWKYFYYLEEAVEEIPEYVVPWEAFRAIAEEYNLELQYRKPFNEVWEEEKDHPVLGPLSERMNVRERDRGALRVSEEEMEAASFYHAFCFYKV